MSYHPMGAFNTLGVKGQVAQTAEPVQASGAGAGSLEMLLVGVGLIGGGYLLYKKLRKKRP